MTRTSATRRTLLRGCAGAALVHAALPARAAVGPPVPGVDRDTLVVGQDITLANGRNAYGQEVQSGIKAMLDELNRQGGVHGRRVVLRTLDDDNQGDKAEGNARRLIDDGVFVLFGSIEGGPSTAVMRVAVQRQVPFFGPIAGSPELRRPHQPLVFPVRAEHRDEFRALVQHAVSLGYQRVGLFHANSGTGKLHLESVQIVSREARAEVVSAVPFDGNITDEQLDAVVRQLAQQRTQVMLNHGSPAVYARLVRRAAQQGLRTRFMAVNSGSSQIAAALGPLAHGMVFAQVVPNPWSGKTALAREYQGAFGRAFPGREFSYGSLEGYATARALAAALERAGPQPTRTGFVNALEAGPEIDLGGMRLSYRPGGHRGSAFVDLSMVNREGRFLQ